MLNTTIAGLTCGLALLGPAVYGLDDPQDPPRQPPSVDTTADIAPDPTPDGSNPTNTSAPNATPAKQTLKPVVITATRSPTDPFDTPYSVDVVSQKNLNESASRTLPDALSQIPSAMIQKTSHGQGSPFLRGFTGFRNVLLIDGVRLNNSVFRDGPNQYWNTVDPLSLSRLEVVKGPSSVLYGSDAVGGTVNAITKDPYSYGQGVQAGGRAYYRVSSAENSHTGRGEVSLTVDDKFGILAGGTGKHYGDLIGGDEIGRQPETGYDEFDADFKAEYFLNPDTKLVALHQRVRQNNVPRTHTTIFAKSFAGTTIGSDRQRDLDQERELTYVQLHAENLDSFIDSFKISLSHYHQAETQDRIRGSGSRDLQGFGVDTFGLWTQFQSSSPIGQWTYGLEYYHDNVNSSASNNPIQGPVADDATYDLLGLFVQDTIPIATVFELTLGGRFTYASADANNVQDPDTANRISISDDWSAAVGNVRLLYHVDPQNHWNLFAGVSQGFRAPNLSDLTRLDTARTNEIETPSPNLDPEFFLSFEAGLKAQHDRFTLQAAYYYTDIQDMIVRTPTGNTIGTDTEVTKKNAGDGFVQGLEFAANLRLHPQWSLFGSLAWMDGQVDTFPTSAPVIAREPIDRLLPLTGLIGLRWNAPDKQFWAEAVVTLAAQQDRLSTRDRADTQRIPPGGTPGYEVFTLRGGWNFNDHLAATLALENVLDEDYRIHGSGSNEAGRNLVFTLDMTF